MSTFDDAFEQLIGNEGGYSNHLQDPGGETMWGITQRIALSGGYTGPMQDLLRETARHIAKALYWDSLRCDSYDARVAFQVLCQLQRRPCCCLDAASQRRARRRQTRTKNDRRGASGRPGAIYPAFCGRAPSLFNRVANLAQLWARRIATNLRVAGA